MRMLRALFLSALGLVAGCGGCDSCFGKATGEDASVPSAPATPTVLPQRVVDAAPEPEEPKTEKDAGKDSAAEPFATAAPIASSLPRPKAPMPMGAFQSCGVYDGPVCEKTCDKGACRQECDGVDCVLTCKGGYCSQLCGANSRCKLSCAGGHCRQACTRPDGCVKECEGANCD